MSPIGVTEVYARRFGPRSERRRVLWETLCDAFFQRYVRPTDTVLDIAAGYCEFINAIRAERRIACDLNPAVADFAGKGVEAVVARSTALPAELQRTADVVFASNFFEHLADADELLATLGAIAGVLKPGGRLLVLQPNIRLTGAAYWDFVDHSLPITERRLAEALELSGFTVEEQRVRFLPYTTESRLPIWPRLIRLYLRLPPAQFLLGKQTFVVARALPAS
jgi:SAM-dependent methyltransferase